MLRLLALGLLLAATPALAQTAIPFQPDADATVAVASTTSNANGTLPCANTVGPYQIRVFNGAANTAFIRPGGSATTSSMPVAAGVTEVLTFPIRTTTVGVILISGTGTVYFTCGAGT